MQKKRMISFAIIIAILIGSVIVISVHNITISRQPQKEKTYEVYIPEKESDLIWKTKAHNSGKTIDYYAFTEAYDKARESSTKKIECTHMTYTVTVPFQFEDKGHTFIATRPFYSSEISLMNDHECYQLYDVNDEAYYYIYNILSPFYDEKDNVFFELYTPDE